MTAAVGVGSGVNVGDAVLVGMGVGAVGTAVGDAVLVGIGVAVAVGSGVNVTVGPGEGVMVCREVRSVSVAGAGPGALVAARVTTIDWVVLTAIGASGSLEQATAIANAKTAREGTSRNRMFASCALVI
ncbi:MAG: hypothetical protein F4Y49_11715 [Dehalococcoidia bacterium]|nr:hypothetical protein [Dehalococcoidia bacterium]